MITHIHIQNYRSFVDAEVDLQPFSLVIGANGAGKTNLLRSIRDADDAFLALYKRNELGIHFGKHSNHQSAPSIVTCNLTGDDPIFMMQDDNLSASSNFRLGEAVIYSLSIGAISRSEAVIQYPRVQPTGAGTAQVLEALKNGDREDLFERIEECFRRFVPEVEKLSLRTVEEGKKQIQVRERGLKDPLPATELSEGTRLILCILTIIHQEKPPPVILLEDIDRGMHPRIFEQMVPLMKDIAKQHDINIIATTHNPFLVDCFEDDPEAVIIVEKKDGASTLSTLKSRMEGLDYDKANPDEMPLGNLWYSGLVGGVPLPGRRRNRREA